MIYRRFRRLVGSFMRPALYAGFKVVTIVLLSLWMVLVQAATAFLWQVWIASHARFLLGVLPIVIRKCFIWLKANTTAMKSC